MESSGQEKSTEAPLVSVGVKDNKAPWSSLFTPKESCTKLEYYEPKGRDAKGRVCVAPPLEIAEEGAAKWRTCAVGFFLGKRPPFLTVKRTLEKIWASYGLREVMTSGQGVFILKFQDMDGVSRAVEVGQITIGGQPFIVRKWTTNLPMMINDVKKVAIWVRLYGIPLEFWSPKGLSYIASAIGNPLYMDAVTEGGTRLEFARICIEIKVDAECPETINLTLPNGENLVINVEYSWKPLKCNGCQCFGHSTANCHFAPKHEGSTSSWKNLKDGDGMITTKKLIGKDSKLKVANGNDKKAKGKGVENHNLGGNTNKNNRYSALAIHEANEQIKRSTMMVEEVYPEKTNEEVISAGKEKLNEASTSKSSQGTTAKGIDKEEEEASTNGGEDLVIEGSPTIVPFGGKLKVDEMDFRKKEVDAKTMSLGKKLAKLKKANSTPLSSK
ncbi:uncharacterized protein LOC123226746 [Mangifera indica]|uniref:uncharacterized protein LOC123226746 n=1 Tax=Mangifera indica TaxID=29780 RepID=UPI001CF9AFA7|nr:uncharacterized protein LOC123226746 [Mangifera indica]